MKEKKWYQSSTMWINLAGVVAVALDMVIDAKLIPDADVIAIMVAVLNIVNRFRVQKPSDVKAIEKSLV